MPWWKVVLIAVGSAILGAYIAYWVLAWYLSKTFRR